MIGLTGGIATGKSTVARRLQSLGAFVLDADQIARDVVEPYTPGWEEVRRAFPDVIREDHTIDRQLLGKIIFNDDEARKRLEEIIHPLVLNRMQTEGSAQESTGKIVVCDIPLLYESGSDSWLSEVWVVYADPKTQLTRLMERNHIDEALARQMISAQMPLEEKVRRADRVIDNSGSLQDTLAQVDALWKEIS